MMKTKYFSKALLPLAITLMLGTTNVVASVLVQCPGDRNEDANLNNGDRTVLAGEGLTPEEIANIKCMHLASGDGFATLGDGSTSYIFGFSDLTGLPTRRQNQKEAALQAGMLAAQWPAPTIDVDEGNELYLTLTNVGMLMRPDLFDPHTVHVHGFPEAGYVFDGIPDASISINMGASLTYYYKFNDPGTYMYHCHVEAAEHMQMGMLGNLYVKPNQNGTSIEYPAGSGKSYTQFAYNDGDGATGYDVDYPIQMGSFDSAFHIASETVQPLPFALMKDDYAMINGRGYPDTVDPRTQDFPPALGSGANPSNPAANLKTTQAVSSLVTADPGQRVLLRVSNLNITRFYTLQSLGLPMQVVGKDAKLLRGPDGKDLFYSTNSVTLGGGESYDVILDTTGTSSGDTFFLYAANLNYLSNGTEEFGGMMTEIRIN
jgi:FtsP/CotA-like multicopper oxidase with cupredoxin domain